MLTPWKESYDQPRQHIEKQRHYFVNKGPSSQGYGFSIGHVWMWELDYKEGCCCFVASVVSDSVQPHRWQPTRLRLPWDSPSRNTGVGCHFLLQYMTVKSESEVAQSCPTLRIPWTAAYQAPPSMGFSRQEYWSGLPLPSPKEGWVLKNWCFWTMVLEKTLESPWDCKEIQPVHPKGDQPWIFIRRIDVEAETPILWLPDAKSWLIWKDPDAGKDWGQEEKGTTEDEMVGWHHRFNGHGFGWIPGVGNGQGSLVCCGSWGRKESDTTGWLNWLIHVRIWWNLCTLFYHMTHTYVLKHLQGHISTLSLKVVNNSGACDWSPRAHSWISS